MHVLVCICSNVRQFHIVWPGPLNCYATHSIADAYVQRFAWYQTEKAHYLHVGGGGGVSMTDVGAT